ncbi:MAG: DUF4397 domain-containing protein [Gemmatimonadaceae bacterium]|nr:DUF4397 domain-containing protein [Gemmatimonadaceae bacterium]
MTLISAGVMRVAHRTSLAVLGLAALLTGCGTKDATDPLIPGPQGRVRFVTLITDTTKGRVNVLLENVAFGVNLVYGGTTPSSLPSPANAIYSPIQTGTRSLVLKRTADTTAIVATFPLTIANAADYTVYATGGAAASAITAFVTTDTNTTPALGTVRVRVVHVAPSAGNVDVFVTAVGADLSLATPVLTNVPYRGLAYLPSVAPGTYQVRAVPAGTAAGSRAANVVINLASIALPANGARTIVAADNNIGGAPYRFIVLTDR